MKNIFLYSLAGLFLCLALPLQVVGQNLNDYQLLNKYWRYKDRFYRNHIRIDWGGDGIGVFENYRAGNPAWSGLYTRAGFSVPADEHLPGHNRWFWRNADQCSVDPYNLQGSGPQGSDHLGLLNFGEDATGRIGRYLSVLATEYELLLQSGQTQRAEQTLEEIYLALQSIRRLNMTANQWIQRYLNVTDFQCNTPWSFDISGYSSICIRNDVPLNFWEEFHSPTVSSHPTYQNVNPLASDEYGLSTGIAPFYNCPLYPDGFPDVNTIFSASSAGCSTYDGVEQCGYTTAEAPFLTIASTDPLHIAHEIKKKIYLSHDQVIALLHGLALVNRFVPPNTIHNGVDVNQLCKDIAESFGNISFGGSDQNWYIPPCVGFESGHDNANNACGYDWSFTKYGICEAINAIVGHSVCNAGWRHKNTFNLLPISYSAFQPIGHTQEGLHMNFQFYNQLHSIFASGNNDVNKAMNQGFLHAPWIEPFFALYMKVLHNISDADFITIGQNPPFLSGLPVRANVMQDYRAIMESILSTYGCSGNGIPESSPPSCTSQHPHGAINTNSIYYYRLEELTSDRIGKVNMHANDNLFGDGLDYMLLYNLYHLAFLNSVNYYDTYSNQNIGNITNSGSYVYPYQIPFTNQWFASTSNPHKLMADNIYSTSTVAANIGGNTGNATFKAGNNITLQPGFLAQKGAFFEAVIGRPQCDDTPGGSGHVYRPVEGSYNGSVLEEEEEDVLTKIIEENKVPISEHDVLVYPNPSSGSQLNLALFGGFRDSEIQVEVFDVLGKRISFHIQKQQSDLVQLNLDEKLLEGIYYITVHNEQGRITKKVVLTK